MLKWIYALKFKGIFNNLIVRCSATCKMFGNTSLYLASRKNLATNSLKSTRGETFFYSICICPLLTKTINKLERWLSSKLRRRNRSRSPNQLILRSNCLWIKFFDPILSSESELSRRNLFQQVKKIYWKVRNRSTLIKKRSNYIKNHQKVKINQLVWYKSTILIL